MSHTPGFTHPLAGILVGFVSVGVVAVVPIAAPAVTSVLTRQSTVAAPANVTQYVNPFIGTDDSNSPNPVGGGAGGSTYPGAIAPFGMVQFSPDTPTASPSGYRDSDRTIQEFSLTHFDGAGCANNEDIGILPVTGPLGSSPGTSWTSYASGCTKANEAAAPGYYRNRLDRYSTTVELTATTRTGMAKLAHPATTSARVLVNTSRSATGNRSGGLTISGSQITGNVTAGGFCGSSKTYKIYFAMQFDRGPTGFGTFNGGTVSAGSASTSGTDTGGYVTFDTSANATVTMKVALSFVSTANASANLSSENPNFDFAGVRAKADTGWNGALNRVQVSGGGATPNPSPGSWTPGGPMTPPGVQDRGSYGRRARYSSEARNAGITRSMRLASGSLTASAGATNRSAAPSPRTTSS